MTDKIRFRCPNCSKVLAADVEKVGKKAKCPGCSNIFTIPQPNAKPAPAAVKTAAASAAKAAGGPSPQPPNPSANNTLEGFRFMDGFSHGPRFNVQQSEGYSIQTGDDTTVMREKAALLRAHIEVDRKEQAARWTPKLTARFLGLLIDWLIIAVPVCAVVYLKTADEVRATISSLISSAFSVGEVLNALKQITGIASGASLAFALLWIVYQGLLVGFKGATVGKMAAKIMVMDADYNPIGIGRAFARAAAYMLSFALFPLSLIPLFTTTGKRGVHDLIAGTVVAKSTS